MFLTIEPSCGEAICGHSHQSFGIQISSPKKVYFKKDKKTFHKLELEDIKSSKSKDIKPSKSKDIRSLRSEVNSFQFHSNKDVDLISRSLNDHSELVEFKDSIDEDSKGKWNLVKFKVLT